MGGGSLSPPPLVKQSSLSTFLGSNEMVTHLGHGNGGSHDVKGSKTRNQRFSVRRASVFINKFQSVSQLSVNDHSKFSWNPSHINYSSCLDASADALGLKYLVLTLVLTH